MKEIKFLLLCLAVALYTSSWWTCAMFGCVVGGSENRERFPIVIFPAIFTIILFVVSAKYVMENWDKE
jgi:ABC-type uncharacterized transport system permease subunit